MILADELPVIFDDRNSRGVSRLPILATVYVMDLEFETPPQQRQEFLNQDLAKVTSLAAVDIDSFQHSFSTVGMKRRRQSACRNFCRLKNSPTARPSSAAPAAPTSPALAP